MLYLNKQFAKTEKKSKIINSAATVNYIFKLSVC